MWAFSRGHDSPQTADRWPDSTRVFFLVSAEMPSLPVILTLAALKTAEKRRLWDLLKAMVSREVQLRLAAMSGAISVRKDIAAAEHSWNQRDDYDAFFPSDEDVIIHNDFFPPLLIVALSSLYEQHTFFGAAAADILRCMDAKVNAWYEGR